MKFFSKDPPIGKMPSIITPLFILLVCASSEKLFAQTPVSFKGIVTDHLNRPVPEVSIAVYSADSVKLVATSTDEKGRFSLTELPVKYFFFTLSRAGYQTEQIGSTHLPFSEKTSPHKFTVHEAAKRLQEVTVTARKDLIERKGGKTVLNVESDVMSTGSTVLDLLQKAPDVQLDDNNNITLKGKSSVQIMLDGKVSYLPADQIIKLLKNMPGSAVSSIEIISQPGAQYEASGNAGIINIKTKIKRKKGFNADFTLGLGLGSSLRHNDNINLNFNKGRFNLYGVYSFSDVPSIWNLAIQRIVKNNQQYTYFNQSSEFHERSTEHFLKAGLDYTLSPNQTLGISISRGINHSPGYQNTNTLYANLKQEVDTILKTHSDYPGKYLNTTYSINYHNILDTNGREFTASADFSTYQNQDFSLVKSAFFSPSGLALGPQSAFKNFLPSNVDISALKADYSFPLNSHSKWATGLKYSRVKTSNSTRVDTLGSQGYSTDILQSNNFNYTESIVAAYVSLNTTMKNTQLQLGLRLEQTFSEGLSSYKSSDSRRRYLDFFPNIAFTQKLGEEHQLEVSYARRIDRPSYGDLNPFRFYIDKNTFGIGNPLLKAQYTDGFELDHTYRQNIISSFNIAWTKDFQIPVSRTDSITRISNRIPQNINHLFTTSLAFSIPLTPIKGWMIIAGTSANYSRFQADSSVAGIALKMSKLGFNLNMTNTIDLPWKVKMMITGYFHSPYIFGFTISKPQYLLSTGLKKSLLEGKGDIKLSVNDIFNINEFAGHQVYGSTNRNLVRKTETRFATLSFSYRLGIKPKTISHESSLSDEQSRVSSPGK